MKFFYKHIKSYLCIIVCLVFYGYAQGQDYIQPKVTCADGTELNITNNYTHPNGTPKVEWQKDGSVVVTGGACNLYFWY